MVTGATRHPRPDMRTENNTNPFDERHTQHCYNTRSSVAKFSYRHLYNMTPEDASDGESDDQMDQVMAAIRDLPRRLHTTQAKTKLLQSQVPVFKGQKEKYNECEHLLLNHIRPFPNFY